MKLLILGASGGCGRWLVEHAAAAGDEVTALVRPSTPFEADPGVQVLRGEVLDPSVLERAVAGHDAVLCALGLRRAGKSPWAGLRSPPDLMARVARRLAAVMPRAGVRRLVAVSAAGVRESRAQLSGPVRWLVRQGNVGVAYRDLAEMETALEGSGLDWLAVRPVTLVDGAPAHRAAPVERYGLLSTVRRADVAAWMLAAARAPEPFREHTVTLGSR